MMRVLVNFACFNLLVYESQFLFDPYTDSLLFDDSCTFQKKSSFKKIIVIIEKIINKTIQILNN
jgi:hypothetical protein